MIFYTSITNGYDRLASPPQVDHKFICFYDGDKPDVDGWEYIKLENIDLKLINDTWVIKTL